MSKVFRKSKECVQISLDLLTCSCGLIATLENDFVTNQSLIDRSCLSHIGSCEVPKAPALCIISCHFKFPPFAAVYFGGINKVSGMSNKEPLLISSLRSAAASSPGFVQTHHGFRGRRAAHQPGRPLQL